MIVHIALYKWKENITNNRIKELLELVKGLKDKCEGISEIYVGENYHKESKGLTHGVVVIAENQEALDNYRKHPDHSFVAKDISEIEDDGLGFDFKDS